MSERWRRANMWAALVCGSLLLLAVMTLFLPSPPYLPSGLVSTLEVLVVPICGMAFAREAIPIFRLQQAQRADGTRRWWQRSDQALMRRLIAQVPKRVRVAFGTLFFALWLAGLSSFAGPAGAPTTQGGRYFLNNHGSITEVSRQEYDRAVAYSTRLSASVSSVFYGVAVIMSLYGPLLGPAQEP